MTEAVPWIKWYFDKWRSDIGLRACSLGARGLWVDLLAIMHAGQPYGHLSINGRAPTTQQIASLVGNTDQSEVVGLLSELEGNGVFSLSDDGLIYCRRMVRDQQIRQVGSVNGRSGGSPRFIRGTVPKEMRVRPFKRSDSPAKTARILARSNGLCHWCSVQLQSDHAGPDFFHVDHVVAIRDGGTNDEDNLVASCARCNHERARHQPPTAPTASTDRSEPTVPTLDPTTKLDKEKEEEKKETSLRDAKKGSRIPEDWTPGSDGAEFARKLGLEPKAVFSVFQDYWRGKAGAAGVKLDWPATWRNWCRKQVEQGSGLSLGLPRQQPNPNDWNRY